MRIFIRQVVGNVGKQKLMAAIEAVRERIVNCLESEELRLTETAFRRQGRLGAVRLLHILLQRIYQALQLQLDKFYAQLEEKPVSKQALSKARKHLNPEYVRGFVDITAEQEAKDDDAFRYQGMRLIAIDGSDVALENTVELKESFGCSGPSKDAATALSSVAFDPMSQVIFDGQMDEYKLDERELAKRHVERLLELGLKGSLLLFDRWYPSAEFIGFLYEKGFPFVMRVRRKWNLEADAVKTQAWITVSHQGKTYRVRVLKVKLSTGEVETLLTSLNQKELPIRKAGTLYFNRWKVETSYDLLKSKLQLENFSGKTKVAVLQDFYATLFLANLTAFATQESDQRIITADQDKQLKHARQANRNRAISKLRDVFLCLLMEADPVVRDRLLEDFISDIVRYPVSVVPGRSPQRKRPRKKRFYIAKKAVV